MIKDAGCDAVKFEGPAPARAAAIVESGIPVMGHLGLTPQTATALGGFKAQARNMESARKLLTDALHLEAAGCFALVLEAVPEEVGRIVTERLTIPTIGIGAGRATDGQVIVLNDLLGVIEQFQPRFVKRYAHIGREMAHAVGGYSGDVRSRSFPAAEHCYTMSAEELAGLQAWLSTQD